MDCVGASCALSGLCLRLMCIRCIVCVVHVYLVDCVRSLLMCIDCIACVVHVYFIGGLCSKCVLHAYCKWLKCI